MDIRAKKIYGKEDFKKDLEHSHIPHQPLLPNSENS